MYMLVCVACVQMLTYHLHLSTRMCAQFCCCFIVTEALEFVNAVLTVVVAAVAAIGMIIVPFPTLRLSCNFCSLQGTDVWAD